MQPLYFILAAVHLLAVVVTGILWVTIDIVPRSTLRPHLREVRAVHFGSLYLVPTLLGLADGSPGPDRYGHTVFHNPARAVEYLYVSLRSDLKWPIIPTSTFERRLSMAFPKNGGLPNLMGMDGVSFGVRTRVVPAASSAFSPRPAIQKTTRDSFAGVSMPVHTAKSKSLKERP